MAEQRRAPRTRTLLGGKISWQNLGATIDCTVRNLSRTGACLVVESPFGVPDNFELVFDRDLSCHACRVVWRSAGRIGVQFEPAVRTASEPPLRWKA
jgi:hypothetical protein